MGTAPRVRVALLVFVGVAVAVSLGGCRSVDFGPDPGSDPVTSATAGASGTVAPSKPDTSPAKPPEFGLPEGFPGTFPVYEGNMTGSGRATAKGKQPILTVRVLTTDSAETVRDFYLAEPTKTGWKTDYRGSTSVGNRPGQLVGVSNKDFNGLVRITSFNGLTTVEVNLIVLK